MCFATTGLSRAWPCWLHGSVHSAWPKACLPLCTAPSLCDGPPLLCWLCWGLTSHMVCTSSGPFACHWPPLPCWVEAFVVSSHLTESLFWHSTQEVGPPICVVVPCAPFKSLMEFRTGQGFLSGVGFGFPWSGCML